MFYILAASFVLELALYTPIAWKIRGEYARVLVPTLVIAYIMFAYNYAEASSSSNIIAVISLALILLIAVYRILNILRIIKGRMHPKYLYKVTLISSLSFMLFTLVAISVLYLSRYPLSLKSALLSIAVFQLFVSVFIFLSVSFNLKKARTRLAHDNYTENELPTLSICIPARNETTDLEQCLDALLANDYPKLEILVLDDCSQDKTADIIKSYAHAGVRFVQGSEPNQKWLAKNNAYQRLAKEATGDYILFCGVDTRFSSKSLRHLVSSLLSSKLEMIGVLPRRVMPDSQSSIIQPMRYWWELAPPRWLTHRPPVLSTCWIIKKRRLIDMGMFNGVSRMLLPEAYFARELDKLDLYRFVSWSKLIDVQTVKSIDDQRQTALRTQYPKIHRRPELALVLTLFELIFLFVPFVIVFANLWLSVYAFTAGVLACAFLVWTHILILRQTDSSNVPLGIFNFPLVVLTEIYFGHASMIGYEFGNIEWKGRNICNPIMHVVPQLPNISEK